MRAVERAVWKNLSEGLSLSKGQKKSEMKNKRLSSSRGCVRRRRARKDTVMRPKDGTVERRTQENLTK